MQYKEMHSVALKQCRVDCYPQVDILLVLLMTNLISGRIYCFTHLCNLFLCIIYHVMLTFLPYHVSYVVLLPIYVYMFNAHVVALRLTVVETVVL